MAIQDHIPFKFYLPVFWDTEYKSLKYIQEPFNDPANLARWTGMGYPNKFTGDMCDMRSLQPSWNTKFIKIFEEMGWKDIGTSYYRMNTGTVLPPHRDLYLKYIDIFKLQGKEETIRRAVVFLEDWRPGHYAEYCNEPLVKWEAGQVVSWEYDTLHMAANMGIEPRYTLQITGHI